MRKDQKKITFSNGQSLTLAFTFNAIIDFEDATGVDLMQGGLQDRSPRALRTLVWVLAKQVQPDLTEADVGAMFSLQHVPAISAAIQELTTGGAEDDAEGKPTKAAAAG